MLVGLCWGAGWLGGWVIRAGRDVVVVPEPRLQAFASMDAGVSAGPAAGDVPVVRIFDDYTCPGCGQFEQQVGAELRALADSGRIRLVYHHVPRLGGSGRAAVLAAAAYCSADAGRAWAVHRELYRAAAAVPASSGDPSSLEARVAAAAARAGANPLALRECLAAGRARPHLDRDRTLAERLGVHAVPTIFVDDARIEVRSWRAALRHVRRLAGT